MSGKLVVAFALLVLLLVSAAAASPDTPATARSNILQKLLAQKEAMKPEVRVARRPHLSEDEREMMTKQIVQALSEVMNSNCMSDRDYQGWVDFGRRDAE
ncbi:cholecystokinin [Kryptolebias marmoratus]|nr:cholecystokinin [Kryptolebias marmoratus]